MRSGSADVSTSDKPEGLGIHILADAAFAVLIFASRSLLDRLASRRPTYRRGLLFLIGVCWILSNLAYVLYIRYGSYAFLALSTLLFVWVLVSELNQFWRIGLIGADSKINEGIDYVKALNMSSNSLDFLGIGASKMTKEVDSFEAAMNRCDRQDHPIRFLLSSPEDAALQEIARKAGVDQSAYQKRVSNRCASSQASKLPEPRTSKSDSTRKSQHSV